MVGSLALMPYQWTNAPIPPTNLIMGFCLDFSSDPKQYIMGYDWPILKLILNVLKTIAKFAHP